MGNKKILAIDDATGSYGQVGGGAVNAIVFADAGGSVGLVALPAGTLAGNDLAGDGPAVPVDGPRLAQIDGDPQTLTSSATITYDASAKNSAVVTLSQAGHTLDVTNALPGQRGMLAVYQDGTGLRTISTYKRAGSTTGVKFPTTAAAPVLVSTALGVDIVEWWYLPSGDFLVWRSS